MSEYRQFWTFSENYRNNIEHDKERDDMWCPARVILGPLFWNIAFDDILKDIPPGVNIFYSLTIPWWLQQRMIFPCSSTQCAKLKFNGHKIDTLWYDNFGNYLLQCVNFSTNQSLVFIFASTDTNFNWHSVSIPC